MVKRCKPGPQSQLSGATCRKKHFTKFPQPLQDEARSTGSIEVPFARCTEPGPDNSWQTGHPEQGRACTTPSLSGATALGSAGAAAAVWPLAAAAACAGAAGRPALGHAVLPALMWAAVSGDAAPHVPLPHAEAPACMPQCVEQMWRHMRMTAVRLLHTAGMTYCTLK